MSVLIKDGPRYLVFNVKCDTSVCWSCVTKAIWGLRLRKFDHALLVSRESLFFPRRLRRRKTQNFKCPVKGRTDRKLRMDDGQDEADAIDGSEEDAEQKEVEMDFNTLIQTTGSVHTSANLIFHFSNKNGNRKYYLSLSYLHILKYRQK